MPRERRRVARSLPRRMPNRLEYSGTRRETAATGRADTPAQAPLRTTEPHGRRSGIQAIWLHRRPLTSVPPSPDSSPRRRRTAPCRVATVSALASRFTRRRQRKSANERCDLDTERLPRLSVRRREGTDDYVVGPERWQHAYPNDLAQPAFQQIPGDAVLTMLGHDETDAGAQQRGSCDAELQTGRPHTLPLTSHSLEIRLSRETLVSRKTERLRRRRTCPEA